MEPDRSTSVPSLFNTPAAGSKRLGWLLALGLVALSGALLAAGIFVYENQRRLLERHEQNELMAIADIKVAQVGGWLSERRADAESAAADPFLVRATADWIARGAPADDETGHLIAARLANLRAAQNYRGVVLIDPAGRPRAGAGDSAVDADERERALQAMATRKALLTDLYRRDAEGEETHSEFDVFAPLLVDADGAAQVTGALYFKVDPQQYLFPLIAAWPTSSPSAEALLVRREGEEVVYLTEGRHRKGLAFSLRQPVAAPPGQAALAVRGTEGLFEGLDYRGADVLAASRMVPDVPWFLVAKVDTAEVRGPVRTLALIVTVLEVVFMAAIAGGGALWWRHQRARYLMRQYEGELERRALAQHLDYLAKYANDIILLVDGSGRIVEANDRAIGCYGYSREELVGLSIDAIQPCQGAAAFTDDRRLSDGRGVIFEAVHRRKDGTTFSAETSLRAIDVDGNKFYQGIIRDVTERMRSEEAQKLAAQVFDACNEGIVITDANNDIVSVNRAYAEITGYQASEVIGKNPRLLSSGRQDRAFYEAMWAAIGSAGRWEGEMWNRRKNGEVYPQWLSISTVKDERGKICNHIGIFSDITVRKAAVERIQFLAHYDALTRLPNRFLLSEHLRQALVHHQRHRTELALLFLDLDRFKVINDTLGHSVGDELLKAVAQRLQRCVREGDTVGRLGGDEFVVVLPEIAEADDATLVARKIIEAVGHPYALGSQQVSTSMSIGIAIFPDDGTDVATLMQHADVAMYHAKAQGRNNYQFYTEAMNIHACEVLAMEHALRRALEQGELLIHYQPQMDVRTGAIVGVEALVRWQHPEKGLLPAAEFVPVAEACGLITPIGGWVLSAACEQSKRWQGLGLPAMRMTVNISARQFRQKNFADTVVQVLQNTGLAPRYLELDFSERTVMADQQSAAATLKSLSGLGARISIDDFGSDYCSLRCLQRFPIDTVKLDPTLVHDISRSAEAAALAGAVIAMAKNAKRNVLAEGVETPEQFAFLRAQHCDEIQGYFFSAQLAADEVAALLEA